MKRKKPLISMLRTSKRVPTKVFSPEMTRRIDKLSRALYTSKERESEFPKSNSPILNRTPNLSPKKSRVSDFQNLHKLEGNMKIVNLPKLPYGIHKNYSEEQQFSHKHFFTMDHSPPSRMKDYSETSRKLRAAEKLNRVPKSLQEKKEYIVRNKLIYPMKAGQLVCNKNHRVIKAYEHEANRYSLHLKMMQGLYYDQEFKKREKKVENFLLNSSSADFNVEDLSKKFRIFMNSPHLSFDECFARTENDL